MTSLQEDGVGEGGGGGSMNQCIAAGFLIRANSSSMICYLYEIPKFPRYNAIFKRKNITIFDKNYTFKFG